MSTQTTNDRPGGSQLSGLSGFPIHWQYPDDQALFWEWDVMHFPGVLTPLEEDFVAAIGNGFTHAIAAFEIPLAGARYQPQNGYAYFAVVPLIATAEEAERRAAASETRLAAAMSRLGEHWREEALPEVRNLIAAIEAVDVELLTTEGLARHLEHTFARLQRGWDIHFEVILPAYLAVSELEELVNGLVETGDRFTAHRLLQGIPNVTVDSGHALWALAEQAAGSQQVRAALAQPTSAAVLASFKTSAEGRSFARSLAAYLDVYGRRGLTWGLATPSWLEDPTPVLVNLRDFVDGRSADDPRLESARLAAGREQALASVREQIAFYPEPIIEQFEQLLRSAREGIAITEDHNFWIDFRLADAVRQTVLTAGRRLAAAGAITHAEDVLLLRRDELIELVRSRGEARDLIARRRADQERKAGLTPPPFLGSLPAGPPPDDPITRAVLKLFGPPPQVSDDPDLLLGVGASGGTVRGIARVIETLGESHRLAPGEILVAATTSPPWTPLFATAAALVTETGGILSHAAVVAREYGLPTVTGVTGATAVIRDGQEIEVDGDAGVVKILG